MVHGFPRFYLITSSVILAAMASIPARGFAQATNPSTSPSNREADESQLEVLQKTVAELQREVDRLAKALEEAQSNSEIAALKNEVSELKLELAKEKAKNESPPNEGGKPSGEEKSKDSPTGKEPAKSPSAKKGVDLRPIDAIVVGTIWQGNRYGNSGPRKLAWQLQVKTRKGNRITGEAWIYRKSDDGKSYQFTGALSGTDKIEIKTVKESGDPFIQTFNGTIVGDKMTFTYSGVTTHGSKAGGTASLERLTP